MGDRNDMKKQMVMFVLVMMVVINGIVPKQVEAGYYTVSQATSYVKSKYGFSYSNYFNDFVNKGSCTANGSTYYLSSYPYYLFLSNNWVYFFKSKPNVTQSGTTYSVSTSGISFSSNSAGTSSSFSFKSSQFVISNFAISGVTVPTIAPTATPTPTISPTPTVSPTPTMSPTPTIRPTATPRLTATPRPTATIRPTATPRPGVTFTPRPTATPRLTSTPRPTATPKVTMTPRPTSTPRPTVVLTTPTPEELGEDTSGILSIMQKILSLFKIFPLNIILIGWIVLIGISVYVLLKNSIK